MIMTNPTVTVSEPAAVLPQGVGLLPRFPTTAAAIKDDIVVYADMSSAPKSNPFKDQYRTADDGGREMDW